MRSKRKYEIIIYWSDEDQAYISEVPSCLAVPRTWRHTGKPSRTSK